MIHEQQTLTAEIRLVPCFGQTGDKGRFLHPTILERGHAVTAERLTARYEQGGRRFIVHLPFGRNGRELMDLDGYGESQRHDNPAVQMVADSYEPEMAKWLESHPDAIVWTYYGSPTDQDLKDREGRWTEYSHRVLHSVYPSIELAEQYPGRSLIALDKAHEVESDHPVAGLMLYMQAATLGPLMVEAGRRVERWQADAGFSRLMISPRFTDGGLIVDWPGEQIALAGPSGLLSSVPEGWRDTVTEAGFTACWSR